MKVGELKLFPALREMKKSNNSLDADRQNPQLKNPKSEVLSSGAACRMQIRQGTGIEALHPIVLIADFLKEVLHDKE
jgi:hypothetical protein